ncbi:MAG: 4Fe-4S dicluster domain-containing protein [Candidatus Lokiarchaeota archaeon]|nr:4Fe-4S dicluster domain-containing protein [Candidatus Lokiarchaeota archaeon]
MPIKGINFDKCTNCNQCLRECPGMVFEIDEKREQVFFNPSKICISCGHCISVCPEDAIIYENMKDEPLIFDGVRDPSTLIPYEKINQFIRAKRSIRQYKKQKISREVMEKVINSMRYAPTGANLRQMKCLIISDDEKIKELSEIILNKLKLTIYGVYIDTVKEKKVRGIDPIFYNAPHVIILYSSTSLDHENAYIAMTHGMFAAQSLGLGTCWIGFAYGVMSQDKEILKNLFGISGKVLAVITIGYPSVKYFRTPPRLPLKTKGLDELI